MSGGMPLIHPYAFMACTEQLCLHLFTLKISSASSINFYVGYDHEVGALPTSTPLMVTAHFAERLVFKISLDEAIVQQDLCAINDPESSDFYIKSSKIICYYQYGNGHLAADFVLSSL